MIYQKDVQDFLEGIQDETADLIIADPPYGIDICCRAIVLGVVASERFVDIG